MRFPGEEMLDGFVAVVHEQSGARAEGSFASAIAEGESGDKGRMVNR